MEYGEATLADMLSAFTRLQQPEPSTVCAADLTADKEIVIIDTDKPWQLTFKELPAALLRRARTYAYAHGRICRFYPTANASSMKTALTPFLATLPIWAATFLKKTFKGTDPRTGRPLECLRSGLV